MNVNKKFKKGAASFYIVAFSTLVLIIVATSFAAVIISQIERTSNEDLSQSAYDSAMAGVEDAKLAYYNYQNCLAQPDRNTMTVGDVSCAKIVEWIETSAENQNCGMVAGILGRIEVGEDGNPTKGSEVSIQELSSGEKVSNNMQQAYTCVKLQTKLDDYRSSLSSSNQIRVVKVKFDGIDAEKISKVKISWYGDSDLNRSYSNFKNYSVRFPNIGSGGAAAPPTISLALVQTAENFSLNDFDKTVGNTTDRGMIYLVPAADESGDRSQPVAARLRSNYNKQVDNNYTSAYNGSGNYIDKNAFLASNDKTASNLPYSVYCDNDAGNEFACSAEIELPSPVGGKRNNDTFMFVVGLPYGKPTTDFAMQFYCNGNCTKRDNTDSGSSTAKLDNVQIKVDSTGRANDLYRRLDTRLEVAADSSNLSIMGPLELLGGDDDALKKDMAVKCEYNFDPVITENCR